MCIRDREHLLFIYVSYDPVGTQREGPSKFLLRRKVCHINVQRLNFRRRNLIENYAGRSGVFTGGVVVSSKAKGAAWSYRSDLVGWTHPSLFQRYSCYKKFFNVRRRDNNDDHDLDLAWPQNYCTSCLSKRRFYSHHIILFDCKGRRKPFDILLWKYVDRIMLIQLCYKSN